MSMVETALARESARRLLDRIEALASRLEYGAATLVGRRVAVVSPDPGDAMLARLLLAFGATPTFLGPTLQSCADAELLRALSFLLKDQRKSLDAASFAAPEGHGVPVHTWPRATGQVEVFDLVLALGAIPAEPQQAVAALNVLAQLVKVGGDLELFDSPRDAVPEVTARAVREHAAPLSLGIRIAERDPWRLSLTRLAEPLAEYPVEESSDGVILAHCLSRLHFARQFVAGRDVLEAGCATGIGARLFAAAGARRVLGLDLHSELIDRARLLTHDSRIEFRQADLDQPLPCANESFDAVVCTEVLEHITNQEGAVHEFLRVLRPGGRLIVSVPSKDYEDGWAEVNRYGNPYHLHVPTAEELNRLLAPFASVRHFRQLDAVGSVVLADDDLRPAGEFSTPVGNLPSEVRSVRLVVCTKAPAGEELSPPPTLLLHRCFSDYQLAAHQHSRNLRAEILHLRHAAWAEQNRQRNDFEERLQEQRNEVEERLQQRNEVEERLKDPARTCGVPLSVHSCWIARPKAARCWPRSRKRCGHSRHRPRRRGSTSRRSTCGFWRTASSSSSRCPTRRQPSRSTRCSFPSPKLIFRSARCGVGGGAARDRSGSSRAIAGASLMPRPRSCGGCTARGRAACCGCSGAFSP